MLAGRISPLSAGYRFRHFRGLDGVRPKSLLTASLYISSIVSIKEGQGSSTQMQWKEVEMTTKKYYHMIFFFYSSSYIQLSSQGLVYWQECLFHTNLKSHQIHSMHRSKTFLSPSRWYEILHIYIWVKRTLFQNASSLMSWSLLLFPLDTDVLCGWYVGGGFKNKQHSCAKTLWTWDLKSVVMTKIYVCLGAVSFAQ